MSRATRDALTGELFSQIPQPAPVVPGAMDYRKRVAQITADMLADTKKNRYQIASRMSELADVETSKGLLDSYTAPSRDECNLPAWKVPVIEAATGARLLTEFYVSLHGGRVLWGKEVLDADLGRAERELAALQAQVKAMKKFRGRLG